MSMLSNINEIISIVEIFLRPSSLRVREIVGCLKTLTSNQEPATEGMAITGII